jgi:alpha-beta hydrolase superfamily lysophospholipase
MPLTALLVAAAVACAAPKPKPPPFLPKPAKAQSVVIESRGRALAASWRPPRRGMPLLILAHGVGAGKGEWEKLAVRLASRGWGTLALDLRGHGGSAASPDEWKGFDRSGEWPRLADDLLAAAKWAESKKVEPARIAFGGASMGANLAADADARRPGRFLLLLSPGADYRGAALRLRKDAKTLAVASRGDAYAFAASEELQKRGATLLEAPGGHGAPMLDDEATLVAVLDWLAAPR